MRRSLTTLAVTATLVVGVALPAWAQPSFVSDTVPADRDVDLQLRAPDPDGLDIVGVEVAVPTAFAILGCSVPAIGWTCEVKGSLVVFTASAGAIDFSTFTIRAHTPTTNGAHAFQVTQRYNDSTSERFTQAAGTAPVLNVTGGEEPGEQPTSEPTSGPTPQPTAGPSPKPTSPPAGGGTASPKPSSKPATSPSTSPAGTTSAGTRAGTSGGSTGPFRTQTSRGTSFDIMPGASVPAGDVGFGVDAPSVAAPAVSAAEPIAPGEDEDGDNVDLATAGDTESAQDEGQGPGRWIGLGLLLAGGAAAFVQRRMATRG